MAEPFGTFTAAASAVEGVVGAASGWWAFEFGGDEMADVGVGGGVHEIYGSGDGGDDDEVDAS